MIRFCPFEFYSAVLFSGLRLKVLCNCASSLFLILLENLIIEGLYYPRNKCDPSTLLNFTVLYRFQVSN